VPLPPHLVEAVEAAEAGVVRFRFRSSSKAVCCAC